MFEAYEIYDYRLSFLVYKVRGSNSCLGFDMGIDSSF
jgi:hypothetical protein